MSDSLPFDRYEGGGRRPLGKPRQGDLTARHGYGPHVFAQCGFECVYCGLDMRESFESWLQLSVDHVIPRQMVSRGYPMHLVEDITNLVTCCRACNDFGNRFVVPDAPPATDEAFFDLRDRVFRQRRAAIAIRRKQERAIFEKLPVMGPGRPPPPGENP
ncbi:MAG: HNH endonuclease [Erythrobacter sp.]|nr:HNH endonuclease [Erythrobacter sp.]